MERKVWITKRAAPDPVIMREMRRLELPRPLADGSFSVLAADAAGIPRKRTRAQDLITVSRGIRVPAGSDAQGTAALRAYCQLDECTVLCHFTAARIWRVGLPLWADCDWRIHLARPRGGSIPKRANVAGHRLDLRTGDVVMLDGVRVTSPERTFLDLAATLRLDDLVAAGDSLVSEHGPEFPSPRAALTSIEALDRMLLQHAGARNIRRAREALGSCASARTPRRRRTCDSPSFAADCRSRSSITWSGARAELRSCGRTRLIHATGWRFNTTGSITASPGSTCATSAGRESRTGWAGWK